MPDVKCPKGTVHIPAGNFKMGSTNDDPDEQPVHDVFVSGFCMDKHEVTNSQYRGYIVFPSLELKQPKSVDPGFDLSERNPDRHNIDPGFDMEERFRRLYGPMKPAIDVSWYEADAFCKSKGKRLPTEAEWEKAAKGPKGYKHSERIGELLGADVCSYPENGYGLCDLMGKVWEWVADWYDEDADRTVASRDPKGPLQGIMKIIRGGEWFDHWHDQSHAGFAEALGRLGGYPYARGVNVGFRCVADPEGSKK